MAPALSKQFLDIQATIECRFTLKHARGMITTYIHWLYSSPFVRCKTTRTDQNQSGIKTSGSKMSTFLRAPSISCFFRTPTSKYFCFLQAFLRFYQCLQSIYRICLLHVLFYLFILFILYLILNTTGYLPVHNKI